MKLPLTKEQHVEIRPRICVAAFTVLLVALLYYIKQVWGVVAQLFSLASPFFVGFAIAFLLWPIMCRYERLLKRFVFKKGRLLKLTRALAVLLALVSLFGVLALFLVFVMPQLIKSITSLVGYVSAFLRKNSDNVNQILLKFDFLSLKGDELVIAWENIVSSVFDNMSMIVSNLVQISSTIVNSVYQLLVGVITAFYIMMDKELLIARIKKIGYSTMPRERIESLIYWMRRAGGIFSGFITGKILDSTIIGFICYVGMLIFGMEYPILISCIIGVTNVIPFFGPFIGWVPGVLILLIINPMSALWFSVFILVLQQLDGNVIGPHILGDSVGVSALSIMIAIVIGSGLFGFTGMLLSVPVYALAYAIVRTLVGERLKKRDLPTDTQDYVNAPEGLEATAEEKK